MALQESCAPFSPRSHTESHAPDCSRGLTSLFGMTAARPGEYELVRRLLGHRNVQTTINAYIGLENLHASEIFSKIVMQHLDDDLEAAE